MVLQINPVLIPHSNLFPHSNFLFPHLNFLLQHANFLFPHSISYSHTQLSYSHTRISYSHTRISYSNTRISYSKRFRRTSLWWIWRTRGTICSSSSTGSDTRTPETGRRSHSRDPDWFFCHNLDFCKRIHAFFAYLNIERLNDETDGTELTKPPRNIKLSSFVFWILWYPMCYIMRG